MDCHTCSTSSFNAFSSNSIGVFDRSRMTNTSFVFFLAVLLFEQNNFKLTCKIVFSKGFPLACSLPMSLHHTLTKRTSEAAKANSAVCFSNAWSSSPRSRPSEPSRSSTIVLLLLSSDCSAIAIHTPFVVCRRPDNSSISRKLVPNAWFIKVLFPLDCGPMMLITAYFLFHSCAFAASCKKDSHACSSNSPRSSMSCILSCPLSPPRISLAVSRDLNNPRDLIVQF
mmetsp:Transcript_306/g.969  ORF Transcript_306/g.969 Transcript_306/m.969 type:complete len:226 (+) Transcript_306:2694-3371(+)